MERLLARFVALLRAAGVKVSPAETIDAVRALGAGGAPSRARLRAALQLTLVKHAQDLATFQRLFDAFFGGEDRTRREGERVEDAIVAAGAQRAATRAQVDEGERSGLTLAVDDAATDGSDLDLDTLQAADGDAAGGASLAVRTGRPPGAPARKPARVGGYTQGPIYVRLDDEFLARWRNDGVKPFLPEEEAAMEEVVARMVQRLKKDVRRTRSRQSRGRLEVARTLQRNHRHGMVPFVRVLRRRRKETPRLVVLCDVSHSVSHASRFMLLLLHTLQRGLLDVRSFVFNREIAEVTSLLETLPLNETLERIARGEVVDLEDESDFGHAFLAFRAHHLATLRGRPAVILLGDGRNNYNEAHESVLADVRERAGYVIWLTPEDRESWDLGDCLMHVYGPCCDRVEVVKNVEELSAIVEQVVRTSHDAAPAPARTGAATAAPPAPRRLPWRHGGVTVRA